MNLVVVKCGSSVRKPLACCTLEACVPKNLLTGKRATRYKRTSSSMEDKQADDQDPDH